MSRYATPNRFERSHARIVLCNVAGKRICLEDHRLAKAVCQFQGEIFFARHCTQSGPAYRRPCPQKERRHRYIVARNCKLPREVMAFPTPAPNAVAGHAKHGDIIQFGVIAQVVLKTHDIDGFLVPCARGARRQERMRKFPLCVGHLAQRQSVAREPTWRRPVPADSFAIVERVRSLSARPVVQCAKKTLCGHCMFCTSAVEVVGAGRASTASAPGSIVDEADAAPGAAPGAVGVHAATIVLNRPSFRTCRRDSCPAIYTPPNIARGPDCRQSYR